MCLHTRFKGKHPSHPVSVYQVEPKPGKAVLLFQFTGDRRPKLQPRPRPRPRDRLKGGEEQKKTSVVLRLGVHGTDDTEIELKITTIPDLKFGIFFKVRIKKLLVSTSLISYPYFLMSLSNGNAVNSKMHARST